jgi:hypothetical protein
MQKYPFTGIHNRSSPTFFSSSSYARSYACLDVIFLEPRNGESRSARELAHSKPDKCAPAKRDAELIDRLAPIVEHHALSKQFGGEDGRDEA